jgi:hypothetical protein
MVRANTLASLTESVLPRTELLPHGSVLDEQLAWVSGRMHVVIMIWMLDHHTQTL